VSSARDFGHTFCEQVCSWPLSGFSFFLSTIEFVSAPLCRPCMFLRQAMLCTILLFVALLLVQLYYSGAQVATPAVLFKCGVDHAGSRACCVRECAACRLYPKPV